MITLSARGSSRLKGIFVPKPNPNPNPNPDPYPYPNPNPNPNPNLNPYPNPNPNPNSYPYPYPNHKPLDSKEYFVDETSPSTDEWMGPGAPHQDRHCS